MLENLFNCYRHHPQAVVTTFKDHYGSPTGFSGYLFRKGILDITNEDLDALFSYCHLVDDTWIGKICRAKGVNIVAVSDNWLASMNRQATDTHPEWYELVKDTSRDNLIQDCLNGGLIREVSWRERFLSFFTLAKERS